MTITSFSLPADSQPDSNALTSLRDLCVDARGYTESAAAAQRLDSELAAYQPQGLVGPLLELARITGTIQKDGTILRANGAAAGSFVLYLLGLTALNPLDHGFLLERFVDPESGLKDDLWITCNVSQAVSEPSTGIQPDESGAIKLQLKFVPCKQLARTVQLTAQVQASVALDDATTYELLGRGDTSGIDGLDSSSDQDGLRQFQPKTIAELAAFVAVSVPGMKPARERLLARDPQQFPEEVVYSGRDSDQYSASDSILYQEDLMQILHQTGNFTLREAYVLIREICKGNQDRMATARRQLLSGTSESGSGKQALDLVEDLAAQTRCKAHCYATAYDCYEAAYLKATFPSEFKRTG